MVTETAIAELPRAEPPRAEAPMVEAPITETASSTQVGTFPQNAFVPYQNNTSWMPTDLFN